MPTEDAEFTQGEPGVDEQMGQGEAAELNDGLELAREMDAGTQDVEAAPAAGGAGAEMVDDSMQEATMADFQPKGGALNEDMKFVTGPSLKPDEAQWVGSRSVSGPVSARVRRRMGTLQKAAAQPGASPRLQAIVKWLLENS